MEGAAAAVGLSSTGLQPKTKTQTKTLETSAAQFDERRYSIEAIYSGTNNDYDRQENSTTAI